MISVPPCGITVTSPATQSMSIVSTPEGLMLYLPVSSNGPDRLSKPPMFPKLKLKLKMPLPCPPPPNAEPTMN